MLNDTLRSCNTALNASGDAAMKYCAKCAELYSDHRRACSNCRLKLLYLPREVRRPLTTEDGVIEVWSERELSKLRADGAALPVRRIKRTYYIAQHHVLSLEALHFLLSAYENIAAGHGLRLMFRGQTRDYFDAAGGLIVLPAVARDTTVHWQYQQNQGDYREAFTAW